MTEIDTRGNTL